MVERKMEAWNLREDLLLVCAVQRHGFESWDNISMEFQRQVESPPTDIFTPQECMSRFRVLKDQFLAARGASDDEKMLEYMRKQFTELRKEVLRCQLETENQNIELLKQKLEGQRREMEEGGEVVAEVAVEANKGDDEPSLKMDGGDKPVKVNEANQRADTTWVRDSRNLIPYMIMNRVLKRLQRYKSNRLFFHKLQTQGTNESYTETIMQHMDLDLIQSMMNQDEEYTYSLHMFFRDLLLMVNNAIVFFDEKKSEEHILALHLRKVVREEMEKETLNPITCNNNEDNKLYLIVTWAPSYEQAKKVRKPRRVEMEKETPNPVTCNNNDGNKPHIIVTWAPSSELAKTVRKPRRVRIDAPVRKKDGRRYRTRSMNE